MSDPALTRRSVLAGLAASAALLSLPARAGDDGVFNVVSPYPDKSPQGNHLDKWKKSVMGANNDRFKVRFKQDEDAGDEQAVVNKLMKGKFEGGMVSSYGLGRSIAKLNVLSLPYLFGSGDPDVVERKLKAARGEIKTTLEGKGLHLCWMFYAGRDVLVSNDLDLGAPASFRGVRIGVLPGAHAAETWTAMGAKATETTLAEMPDKLRSGAIQAASVSLFEAARMPWPTPRRKLALTYHSTNVGFLTFNKELFDKMAKKDQEVLVADRGRRQTALFEKVKQVEQQLRENLNVEGFTPNVLTEREQGMLASATEKVHTTWLENHAGAKGLYKTIRNA